MIVVLAGLSLGVQEQVCISIHGPVAQLGERLYGMEKVRGSSPLRSTTFILNRKIRVVPRKDLSSLRMKDLFLVSFIFYPWHSKDEGNSVEIETHFRHWHTFGFFAL